MAPFQRIGWRLAAVAAIGFVTTGFANPQAPTGIARVTWLHGCWTMASGDRIVEEQWMAPRAGAMLGMGRTVRGDRLVEYELVVVREHGEGLAYEAHPSGQPSATFASKTIAASMVVFENLQHDFPQRVAYERRSPDELRAWIEGDVGGKPRRVEFVYQRAACGGR